MSKIHVAVLFGGRSSEHNISLLSAYNIINSLGSTKYHPIPIYINQKGQWSWHEQLALDNMDDPHQVSVASKGYTCILPQHADFHQLQILDDAQTSVRVDVLFPILHGMYGEDGAIQGFARLTNLPCVGPDILGSAIGMDKEVMKRLLRDAGIKSAPWITLRRSDLINLDIETIITQLGARLFVKPVNLGSSVGITHVTTPSQLEGAIRYAFEYDNKVIIEQQLYGREIECAVLGNQGHIEASIPGEVKPKDGFYSFEAKYVDDKGTELVAPAQLTDEEIAAVQMLAKDTFVTLECCGLARVDMFLTDDGLYINEINTLPGFTNISMYPKLWELSGRNNQQLMNDLVELAIAKNNSDNARKLTASL